jgi:hypothetical protein
MSIKIKEIVNEEEGRTLEVRDPDSDDGILVEISGTTFNHGDIVLSIRVSIAELLAAIEVVSGKFVDGTDGNLYSMAPTGIAQLTKFLERDKVIWEDAFDPFTRMWNCTAGQLARYKGTTETFEITFFGMVYTKEGVNYRVWDESGDWYTASRVEVKR